MSRRGGSALALSLVSWATRPRLLWYSAPPSVHRSRKSNGRTRCELTRGHSSLLPVQRAISGYSPCTLSSGVDSLSTLRWSPTHPTHPTHLDCRVMRLLDHVRPAVHGMFDDRRIRLGILLPRFPSQRVMPRLPHARRLELLALLGSTTSKSSTIFSDSHCLSPAQRRRQLDPQLLITDVRPNWPSHIKPAEPSAGRGVGDTPSASVLLGTLVFSAPRASRHPCEVP